jgi:hypothetical protein
MGAGSAPPSPAAPLASATPGLNFDGVGVGFSGPQGAFIVTGVPPDPNGAVGDTQYVQWVNTSFAVFNKATSAVVYGPVPGNILWQGFGGQCELQNDGDPIVLFDHIARRWVFSQFAVSGGKGKYYQCIAVSTTSDATGTFNRYAFLMPDFNDYAKIAVWPDAYYTSFNLFTSATGNFIGGYACALDRVSMLAGTAASAQCFSSAFGGLLPSDLDGSALPPAGSPNYYLALDTNSLDLWRFHVDFAVPGNSTFTGPTSIPVDAYSQACGGATCIPQPGTSQQLDSLGDRLMHRLAYRNFGTYETIVTNHSIDNGGPAAIRWYEIRNPGGTPTVHQQGTYAPDATSRWMGSIAMDAVGDIAVGYSTSSSTIHPSVAYTGRLAADPLGTLQAESVIISGVGSQTMVSRWGDYSGMTIDPIDDCTFWYTNEYLQTNGQFNWSTRIASFKFPGCLRPTVVISGGVTLNVTMQLQTAVPTGGTVQCELILAGLDASGAITEDVTATATVSGSTATCVAPISYSWTLSSPTTDTISVTYAVAIVPKGATTKADYTRYSTRDLPPIVGVPPSGTQTSLSDVIRL